MKSIFFLDYNNIPVKFGVCKRQKQSPWGVIKNCFAEKLFCKVPGRASFSEPIVQETCLQLTCKFQKRRTPNPIVFLGILPNLLLLLCRTLPNNYLWGKQIDEKYCREEFIFHNIGSFNSVELLKLSRPQILFPGFWQMYYLYMIIYHWFLFLYF